MLNEAALYGICTSVQVSKRSGAYRTQGRRKDNLVYAIPVRLDQPHLAPVPKVFCVVILSSPGASFEIA